jgi:hypothetical protein
MQAEPQIAALVVIEALGTAGVMVLLPPGAEKRELMRPAEVRRNRVGG